jgi:hypothetical protein
LSAQRSPVRVKPAAPHPINRPGRWRSARKRALRECLREAIRIAVFMGQHGAGLDAGFVEQDALGHETNRLRNWFVVVNEDRPGGGGSVDASINYH